MQRPSSTRKIPVSGARGLSLGGRPTSGRSSSLSRLSGASQGRYSESGRTQGKDPRPVTDKHYLQECARRISEFMTNTAYKATHLSARNLITPSLRDFFGIFEHLYGLLKGSFKYTAKPEDEIIKTVKALRYPFTINRSMLLGLGNRQSWGCLLGLLVWMIDLIELLYQTISNFNNIEDIYPDEFDGHGFCELLRDGIAEIFKRSMQGEETCEENDVKFFRDCVETFRGPSKMQGLTDNNEKLVEQFEKLQKEYMDISEMKKVSEKGELDIQKLEQYFRDMDLYFEVQRQQCKSNKDAIDLIENEIAPLRAEKEKLKAILNHQASEVNHYKLAMVLKENLEERLKAAYLQFSKLEDSITDSEVKCCSSWSEMQKLINQREEIHVNSKGLVKKFDDSEITHIMASHFLKIPSEVKPAVFQKDVDQIMLQTQDLLHLLQDKTILDRKTEIEASGTLNELNAYLKDVKGKESKFDTLMENEKAKDKEGDKEYNSKLEELEKAMTEMELKADNKTQSTNTLDSLRKQIQACEEKYVELEKGNKDYEAECILVLKKSLARIRSYEEENNANQMEFLKQIRCRFEAMNA